MRYSDIGKLCLSLPGATLEYPFGDEPVFKVGGKMFALISWSEKGQPDGLWFKAGEASFAILTRLKGISPAPYLARAHWVAMERLAPLRTRRKSGPICAAPTGSPRRGSRAARRKELGIEEACGSISERR